VLKNALFTRETRSLYTSIAMRSRTHAYGSGIETVLSEARKFGVAVVSANQFSISIRPRCVPQFWPWARMHSSSFELDAAHVAQHLTVEILSGASQESSTTTLRREDGSDRWIEVQVPLVRTPRSITTVF